MGPREESFAGRQARDALEELRHHWGEAYDIQQTGGVTWLAARRDGRGAVHANSPEDLEAAITADYKARPVPR
jgi:hypothetical protein